MFVDPATIGRGEYLPLWSVFVLDNKNGAGIPAPRDAYVQKARRRLMAAARAGLRPTPTVAEILAEARELDPMFDPVRKAAEEMEEHPEVAIGTPYIYILGDAEPGIPESYAPAPDKRTPYAQYLADAQQAVAHFENSMMMNLSNAPISMVHALIGGGVLGFTTGLIFFNLTYGALGFVIGAVVGALLRVMIPARQTKWNPSTSFYGKGLVKVQPWLHGIRQPRDRVPGMFLAGMLAGAFAGLFLSIGLGWGYWGLYAFGGMIVGIWLLGGFEGVYHFGAFLAGYFQELSHDYFECSYAGVVHLLRSMVFEPANANAVAQKEREFRWSKGVDIYPYHIFGPGVNMQQRYLMSICMLMYLMGRYSSHG